MTNRTSPAGTEPVASSPTLVGKHFHTRRIDGSTHWQGRVIEEVAPGVYLCGLFEWLMGHEDTRVLVRLEDMLSTFDEDGRGRSRFEFYSSGEEMSDKYERVLGPRDQLAMRQAGGSA